MGWDDEEGGKSQWSGYRRMTMGSAIHYTAEPAGQVVEMLIISLLLDRTYHSRRIRHNPKGLS